MSEFGLFDIDPDTGKRGKNIFSRPGYHIIDTHASDSHPMVQGRSSIVGFRHKDTGVYYCLDAYISTLPEMRELSTGYVTSVRVIEGLPLKRGEYGQSAVLIPNTRILGVAPVEKDGSFHIRVPSQTPLSFQLLDEQGMAVSRQYTWSWVMPGESRGCIGCHEDREMVPPNKLARAVLKPEVKLSIPADRLSRN